MPLNVSNIKQRMARLELCVNVLKQQQQTSFATFRRDFIAQLATERAFQAAIEACIDIATHLVVAKGIRQTSGSREAFSLLAQAGYIDTSFSDSMIEMVKLRNRLVHMYLDIDVARLHSYLQTDVTR